MSYTAADITELDDVQHTRLRPAVNLGLDVLNTALRERRLAVPGLIGAKPALATH